MQKSEGSIWAKNSACECLTRKPPLIGYNLRARKAHNKHQKINSLKDVSKTNYQPLSTPRTDATVAPAHRDAANDLTRVNGFDPTTAFGKPSTRRGANSGRSSGNRRKGPGSSSKF